MDKFEHRLRTTVHTRSVEQIMTRSHAAFPRGREHKLSNPKIDNISTYLRKFEIDRQNLNLAKRIMQCQSEHSRNKYRKEWKKTKKFLRVRSNFKPQLSAEEPKIYKFQGIAGHGRLYVKLTLTSISSHMKQLNSQSLYMLKFILGGTQLIPNKDFLTLQTAGGYSCSLMAPLFMANKNITVKLIKVVQNSLFDAGKFVVNLQRKKSQQSAIISKTGKVIGQVAFSLETEMPERQTGKHHGRQSEANKQNQDTADESHLQTRALQSH